MVCLFFFAEMGVADSLMPLHEHMPIDIKKTVKAGEVSSYKEPWRRIRAVESVGTTNMYEAGGNAFWFRHSTTAAGDEFPCETLPWPLLCQFRDNASAAPKKANVLDYNQNTAYLDSSWGSSLRA